MTIETTLRMVSEFRRLPTYQFERRIDAFLIPYLESAFNEHIRFGDTISDFVLAYPEFPISLLKAEYSSRRSKHVDFVMYERNQNIVFYVEMKTDASSVDKAQFDNYKSNCELGWAAAIKHFLYKSEGIQWEKFKCGILHLNEKVPALLGAKAADAIAGIRSSVDKRSFKKALRNLQDNVHFDNEPGLAFLYLAPSSAKSKLEELNSRVASAEYAPFFSLRDFSKFVEEPLRSVLLEIDHLS